jgi:hypothetical protein
MNTDTANHIWANNARWCADRRYFMICDDATKTREDLGRAYAGWQALSDMSMMHRVINGNLM